MKSMARVGIVGVGMVGSAMLRVFQEKGLGVVAFDKYRPGFTDKEIHFEALNDCDFVFVSVPTLTRDDGTQDLEPLEEVFKRLRQINYQGIVVSKCTTLPGVTKTLSNFHLLKVLHYPEFLRAAHAYDDFKEQRAALISGHIDHALLLAEFLRGVFPNISVRIFKDYASTEIAKYTHNCFLATKISFLNEIYDVCDASSVSYSDMISGVSLMGRIGEKDLQVPGPDRKRGWGGWCFPKDTKAFIRRMSLSVGGLQTLEGAVTSNEKRRK